MDHPGQHRHRGDRDGLSSRAGIAAIPDRGHQTRMTMNVLEAHDVYKSYIGGDGNELQVLNGVNLAVPRGEMIAIVGASGAGKSTLMHVLGALDKPTRGYVVIGGEPVHGRNETELGELRNRTVGFVFQFHHLLREFSALENVMMPLRIAGRSEEAARGRAAELLARVGLSARMTHRPGELSGGEQQRTAVARALAMDPQILLADEPSGNLDRSNAEMLHELLSEVVNDLEIGMVVVTHSRSLAARASKVLLLEGGRLSRTEVDEVVV
jgi:lipoprotein-releasing system ATP-binding protein